MKGDGEMFALSDWILLGLAFILMLCVIGWMFVEEFGTKQKIIVFMVEVVLMVALIFGCAAYNTKTESGKRHMKSWESETTGGIDRTITVYDIEGEEIAKYQGKFDIEESSQEGVVKIKFDCDGKRHIIYAQTGTVLIDEN